MSSGRRVLLIMFGFTLLVTGLLLWREFRPRPRLAVANQPVVLSLNRLEQSGESPVAPAYLRMEAEEVSEMESPFEIEFDEECSGGRCLVVREGAGSGWLQKDPLKRAAAHRSFTVPRSGHYYLWGRVRWESGCSNAFYVHVDDDATKPIQRPGWIQGGAVGTLGKDTTYEAWHWICRYGYDLSAGEHKLTLRNLDDGSRIDQWLLTDDAAFVPQGVRALVSCLSPGRWGGDAGDWRFAGERVRKLTAAASPLVWRQATECGPYYAAFTVAGMSDFRLYFDYHGADRHRGVELRDGDFRLIAPADEAEMDGTSGGKASGESISRRRRGEQASESQLVELWRGEEEILVLLDGRKLGQWRAGSSVPCGGMVAMDVNVGACVTSARVEAMTPIRLSCSHYAEFGQHPFTVMAGEWKVREGAFMAQTDTATAVAGETWWRNAQLTTLVKLPASGGVVELGLRRRDEQNHYLLRLEPGRQSLIRTLDGVETTLASTATMLETKDYRRVTLRHHGADLRAYWDGRLLLRATDDAIPWGKATLAVRGGAAEPRENLWIDDLDIAATMAEPMPERNEPLPVCRTRYGIRVINSVLDDHGPTGGFQPGSMLGEMRDANLARYLAAQGLNGDDQSIFRTLDFQWLGFGKVESICGYGIPGRPGYFRLRSSSSPSWLWSLRALLGDFRFSCEVRGAPRCLTLELRDLSAAPGDGTVAALRWSPLAGNWQAMAGGQIVASGDLPASSSGQRFVVECRDGVLRWLNNGSLLAAHALVPGHVPLRVGVRVDGGEADLDNLEGLVFPDLAYDFQVNHPWKMMMSDWDVVGTPLKFQHGGGYHSHVKMAPMAGDGETAIRSRRAFAGDLLVLAMPQVMAGGEFSIGLFSVGDRKRWWMARLGCGALHLSDRQETIPLSRFDADAFQYPHVLVSRQGAKVTVWVEDGDGSYREVGQSILPEPGQPLLVELGGNPTLNLHQVLIWGREAER